MRYRSSVQDDLMNAKRDGGIERERHTHPFLVSVRMPATEHSALGEAVVFISCFASATEALERVAAELSPEWHVEKVVDEMFPVEAEALRIGRAEIRQLSFTAPEAAQESDPGQSQRTARSD